jgi:hypothetical protein
MLQTAVTESFQRRSYATQEMLMSIAVLNLLTALVGLLTVLCRQGWTPW